MTKLTVKSTFSSYENWGRYEGNWERLLSLKCCRRDVSFQSIRNKVVRLELWKQIRRQSRDPGSSAWLIIPTAWINSHVTWSCWELSLRLSSRLLASSSICALFFFSTCSLCFRFATFLFWSLTCLQKRGALRAWSRAVSISAEQLGQEQWHHQVPPLPWHKVTSTKLILKHYPPLLIQAFILLITINLT